MSAAKTKSGRYGGIISKTLKVRKLINSLFGFLLKAWFSCVGKIPGDPRFYWKRSPLPDPHVSGGSESLSALRSFCTPRRGTPGFKRQGWSKGGKNQNPKRSLGLQTKPKIAGPKFNPPKNPMLNFRGMKFFSWNYAAGICWNYQITDLQIVLNVSKNPHLIKLPKKILAKIPNPKKSCSRNFQTQKITWNPEYLSPTPLGLHPSHFAPVSYSLK